MAQKRFYRIVALLLAALTAIPMLASCGKSNGETGETDTAATDVTGQEEGVPATVANLYGSYKSEYKGSKFRIFAISAGEQWYTFISDTANEVWFEDAGSDVLQKSIYERNQKTENLLGITIVPVWGGSANATSGRIGSDISAGVDEYDVAMTSLNQAMGVAANGDAINLNDLEPFDSSHSWWNAQFVKDCTLFGEDLYTIAGALNIWDDCSNNVVIFNKTLLERNASNAPYQEVFDGNWTVSEFMTRAKAVTKDLNGDTDYDENDSWGIGTYGNGMTSALQGFNSGIAKMNSDGYPEIIANTESNIEKCSYWFDNVTNSGCLYNEGTNGDTSYETMFLNGQLGFILTNLTHPFLLREMVDEYGILPYPKYSAEQEKYTSSINTAFCTSYVIPKNCPDPTMAATCLEVLSGYSVDTLDHSLHDILFESKLTRDTESKQILEILKGTISFDWSGIGNWTNGLTACFEMKQNAPFTLASSLATTIDIAQEGLDEMIAKFEDRK